MCDERCSAVCVCVRVYIAIAIARALWSARQYKRFSFLLTFHLSLRPSLSLSISLELCFIMRRGYLQLALLCPVVHFSVLSSTTKLFVYSLVCIYYLHPTLSPYPPLSLHLSLSQSLLLLFKRLRLSHSIARALFAVRNCCDCNFKGGWAVESAGRGGGVAWRCLAFTFCGLPQLSY